MAKTGILGGTFDPPHYGHLALARAAVNQLKLDKVIFIPAGIPPHKIKHIIAPAADRVAMLKMLIDNAAEFAISDIELRRSGPSYTVDTLAELIRRYPNDEFTLLIGADNVAEIEGWHQPERILTLSQVAAANRPGYMATGKFAGGILYFNMPDTDISSTVIRAKVNAGESISELVPPPIEDFIRKHGLYLNHGQINLN